MNLSTFLPLLVGLVLVAGLLFHFLLDRRSRSNARVPADRQLSGPVFRDDERYWVGGFFYYNPDDPDLLVPKRYGIGQTLNFGHPRAKLVVFGILLLMLVLTLLSALSGGLGRPSHLF